MPAFTLPPHRLRPRPQSNRHPAATVIHNGLSTEKLSTSLLAALCKTFSPSRLRTRIYNISFAFAVYIGFALAPLCHRAPRRRAQSGGGRRQRRTHPRAVPNHAACCAESCRLRAESCRLLCRTMPPVCRTLPLACRTLLPACRIMPPVCRTMSPVCRTMPLVVPNNAACVPNHCAQRRKCTRPTPPLPVRSPRGNLSRAAPPPPKWVPRLRRREGKRPNGAPPHHNAHTPNAERKRYLHNSRTKTQRRTKRCAQFVIFVFTPCKLLHNFSTVLHRSPRNAPKRAQIVARRPDLPCFTAAFHRFPPESHRAKHPRTAPVLPPKNAPLRAYAKPRPHPRVRGTRQHATTCAFFTFSARYERIGGPPKTNFCPAEGRKWGRLWSQMLKNGLQTKKSTFSFGRLVI